MKSDHHPHLHPSPRISAEEDAARYPALTDAAIRRICQKSEGFDHIRGSMFLLQCEKHFKTSYGRYSRRLFVIAENEKLKNAPKTD
jgi:hypothetical protein